MPPADATPAAVEDESVPKPPRNAFQLFCADAITDEQYAELTSVERRTALGAAWKEMGEDAKAPYIAQATEAREAWWAAMEEYVEAPAAGLEASKTKEKDRLAGKKRARASIDEEKNITFHSVRARAAQPPTTPTLLTAALRSQDLDDFDVGEDHEEHGATAFLGPGPSSSKAPKTVHAPRRVS